MTEIHAQVEHIYREHKNTFDILENIFFDEHSIPHEITRDEVKQRILRVLNNETSNKWLSFPKGLTYNLTLYIMAMCYLLWCALFGPRYSRVNVDVLFDYWSSSCEDFYGGILNELPSLNIAAFSPCIDEGHKHSRIPSSGRFVRKYRPYSRRSAWAVFKSHYHRFGIYWSLTKQTNIDFIDLALRLCSEVAGHITSIEGVSSKILVSAHDNGYTPYRYHLYRSNGIGPIFLIQNGARIDILASYNSYIHCDYYIGWSQQRLDDFIEMRCKNKIALGSIKLSNFLLSHNDKKMNVQYDILFLEQNIEPPNPKSTFYLNLLRYFVRYSSENTEIRAAYCRRPGIFAHPSLCKQVDLILRGSSVIILDSINSSSSYEHSLNSALIVSLDSSLRYEALMLDKPVISCSDRHEPHDFIVKYSDPCFVVSTDDYCVFSSKINFLLKNLDASSIANSLARFQKAAVGKVGNNVSLSIANLIKTELQHQI